LAYVMLKIRQILGLCHLPPQMENQCGLWKKNLGEENNLPILTNEGHDKLKSLL